MRAARGAGAGAALFCAALAGAPVATAGPHPSPPHSPPEANPGRQPARGPEPVLLDAGPLASVLAEGFSRLDMEAASDPRVMWLRPPTRGWTAGSPDPLSADALEGGELLLALPPGTWRGAAVFGAPVEDAVARAGTRRWGLRSDGAEVAAVAPPTAWAAFADSPWFAASPRPVFTPGGSAWQRAWRPAHPWVPVTLEVGDDGARVEAFGQPLAALALFPEGVDVAAALAELDATLDAWWRATEGAAATHDPDPPLAGPLATAPLAWTGERATGPAVVERVERAEALRGETVWLPLRIAGGDGPGELAVTASAGLRVTVEELDAFDTAHTPERLLAPRSVVRRPAVAPTSGGEAAGAWRGEQGLPPAVLLRVDATAAGRQRATLRLRRGTEEAVVTVEVRVHDAALPRGVPTGLFLQVPQEPTLLDGFGAQAVRDLLRDELTLLADHGLRALSIRYALWPDRYPTDGTVDAAVLSHVATTWASLGGEVLVWADPKVGLRAPAYIRTDGRALPWKLEAPLTAMLTAARDQPLPVWVPIYEEEAYKHLGTIDRVQPLAAKARALVPGVPLLATMPMLWDLPQAGALDAVTLDGPMDELALAAARVRAQGTRVWAYNLAPGVLGPLEAWTVAPDVYLQWHANPETEDPFVQLGGKDHPWHLLIDRGGALRAGLLLAEFADGVQLAALLAALEGCASLDGPPAVRAAAIVAAARASVSGTRAQVADDGLRVDREALADLRDAARRAWLACPRPVEAP